LGAGFKIAMRDLEIRGAGNILGTQQSGHIAAVGYELYCQLLENAVRRLKNQAPRTVLEVTVELPWKAFLPRDYVPGQRLRIEVYRRLGRVRRLERLEDFRGELRDRFGPFPVPVEWLLRLAELAPAGGTLAGGDSPPRRQGHQGGYHRSVARPGGRGARLPQRAARQAPGGAQRRPAAHRRWRQCVLPAGRRRDGAGGAVPLAQTSLCVCPRRRYSPPRFSCRPRRKPSVTGGTRHGLALSDGILLGRGAGADRRRVRGRRQRRPYRARRSRPACRRRRRTRSSTRRRWAVTPSRRAWARSQRPEADLPTPPGVPGSGSAPAEPVLDRPGGGPQANGAGLGERQADLQRRGDGRGRPPRRRVRTNPQAEHPALLARLFNEELNQIIERELVLQDAFHKLEKNAKYLDKLKQAAAKDFEKKLKLMARRLGKEKEGATSIEQVKVHHGPRAGRGRCGWQEERNFIASEYVRSRIYPLMQRVNHVDDPRLLRPAPQRIPHHRQGEVAGHLHCGRPEPSHSRPTHAASQRTSSLASGRGESFDSFLRLNEGVSSGALRGDIKPVELEPHLFQMKDGQVGPVVELEHGGPHLPPAEARLRRPDAVRRRGADAHRQHPQIPDCRPRIQGAS